MWNLSQNLKSTTVTGAGPDASIRLGQAATAIQVLVEAAAERIENISDFPKVYVEDPSDGTRVEEFIDSGGPETLLTVTNFSHQEFHQLWGKMEPFVSVNWIIGRVRKSKHSDKDVLIMIFVTIKHGNSWDWLGEMFNITGPTFERTITQFIRCLSSFSYF